MPTIVKSLDEYHDDNEDDVISDASDNGELEEAIHNKLFNQTISGNINLDDILVSTTFAGKGCGFNAEHLSNVWRIDPKLAQ